MGVGNCPCRDCQQRTFLCHGQCELYQAWKTNCETAKADYLMANQVPSFPREMLKHCYKLIKEGRRRK